MPDEVVLQGRDGGAARAIQQRDDVVIPTVNLGPLTTTFTPASSCTSLTYYAYNLDGTATPVSESLTFRQGWKCLFTQDQYARVDPSCYPPRYADAYYNNVDMAYQGANVYPVFSPASVCPEGYVSACKFTGTTPTSTTPPVVVTIGSGTTAITSTSARTVTISDVFEFEMPKLLKPDETGIGCCPR